MQTHTKRDMTLGKLKKPFKSVRNGARDAKFVQDFFLVSWNYIGDMNAETIHISW